MEKTPTPSPANNGVTCSTCNHLRRIASLSKTESICARYPPQLIGGLGPDDTGGLSIMSTSAHNVVIARPENWWCGEWVARNH
ncbi:MAG: hypothetical protein V4457_06015 [Pseudomonadota bacterium]